MEKEKIRGGNVISTFRARSAHKCSFGKCISLLQAGLVFDESGTAVLLQKVSSFRSVPLFACTTHLEDLAEPGVEVVCVWGHSAFQIWRLEGDILEGEGWRDRVENLEGKS